jgi:acetyl-CoA carboxylase biotin carboxyl carrier protein
MLSHNPSVEEMKQRIDELAALMEEFSLSEAEMRGSDWKIAFRKFRKAAPPATQPGEAAEMPMESLSAADFASPPVEDKPKGLPVTSPMNGIYYSAPSPNAPSFVKPGESVTAGQVVGLIEAMKVFNEITAPVSGVVDRLVAENGALVEPGEPLLYIV